MRFQAAPGTDGAGDVDTLATLLAPVYDDAGLAPSGLATDVEVLSGDRVVGAATIPPAGFRILRSPTR